MQLNLYFISWYGSREKTPKGGISYNYPVTAMLTMELSFATVCCVQYLLSYWYFLSILFNRLPSKLTRFNFIITSLVTETTILQTTSISSSHFKKINIEHDRNERIDIEIPKQPSFVPIIKYSLNAVIIYKRPFNNCQYFRIIQIHYW